jgi:hypothetical protein
MEQGSLISLQQLIGAAVTPVALIASCATLVLVINAKLSAMADRLRAIAAEYRLPTTSAPRRQQLLDEKRIFIWRYNLTYLAHVLLNLAAVAFILTVPVILVTEHHLLRTNRPTIVLFVTGIGLMLIAMLLEIAEISLSRASIAVELRDIAPLPSSASASPTTQAPRESPMPTDFEAR